MAKTRTMAEIAKDYKACKKYVDEHPTLTSLKEVADALGLSVSQVETSFERHPRTYNGIKKQIAANQEAIKAQKKALKEAEKEKQRKAKQEALEAQKRAEAEAKRKAEQEAIEAKKKAEAEAEAKRKAEQEAQRKAKLEALRAKKAAEAEAKRKAEQEAEEARIRAEKAATAKKSQGIRVVIDASITGIDGIIDTINMICATGSKIILTGVTINELEKMQKFHDKDGNDARRILTLAADDPVHFDCEMIDTTVGSPDDCIIKYCADNKENVILLTSDKTMELKARAYGVKTRFFKHSKNATATIRHADNTRINTLYAARKYGNNLYIHDFGNEFKSIRVISGGIEYNDGLVDLKIGDDVYIAAKKDGYVTFAHYKIVSLTVENNCTCVYSKRLYDLAGINDLPEAGYKSFMRDFKRKVSF